MVQTWAATLPAGSRVLASPYKLRQNVHFNVLEQDEAYAGVYITMSSDATGDVRYTTSPALEEGDASMGVIGVLSRLWHEYEAIIHKPEGARSKDEGARFKTLSALLEAA